MQKPQSTVALLFVSIISIILVTLNVLRILHVPITHDEAYTFFHYITARYKDIIACNPVTANNHIFNSLLTKVFTKCFHAETQFVLRFANLIGQFIYLVYTYLLLRKTVNKGIWLVGAFLILNLNPFFFEFWGLCRGYGLGISFLTAAIYHILCYIKGRKLFHICIGFAFAAMAVYSNLSMLNAYMALIAVLVLNDIIQKEEKKIVIQQIAVVFFWTLILYILLIQPIIELRSNDQFYYGGDLGFIQDTIYSLLKESLYIKRESAGITIASYIIAITTCLFGVYWLWALYKKGKQPELITGLYLWLFLMITVVSVEIQHLLMGTRFLIERTALLLWPLYTIQLVYFLYMTRLVQKGIIAMFAGLMLVLTIVNFICHYNTRSTRSWAYDKDNITVLKKIMMQTKGEPTSIRPFWIFIPSLQYYTYIKYSNVHIDIDMSDRNPTGKDTMPEFYYIDESDLWRLSPVYKPVDTFQQGNFILLRKTSRH